MYTSSVDIRPDWRVLEQVNFSALTKLSLSVDEPEDLAFCGTLWHYDKTFDRLTAKNTRRLEKTQRVFATPAASEDPMLMYVDDCNNKTRRSCFVDVYTPLLCRCRVVSWCLPSAHQVPLYMLHYCGLLYA